MDYRYSIDPQEPDKWQRQQYQRQEPLPPYPAEDSFYPVPGKVGFGTSVKICFCKYTTFRGRAPRAEYWWWMLFNVIIFSAVMLIPVVGILIDFVVWLALIIPNLSVSWRRLHDTGKSGAWFLLTFIPGLFTFCLSMVWAINDTDDDTSLVILGGLGILSFVTGIIMLVWMLLPGEPRPNRYGLNPYGIDDGRTPGSNLR